MVKILVARKLTGLFPVDETGEVVIRKFTPGEVVSIDVKRPRNVAFHRKFFAMLNIILQNQDAFKSIDDLLELTKLRTGHCHTVLTKAGEVKITDSISFAAMDQDAFNAFYQRACAWVCSEVIPGLSQQDLDEEVQAQLQDFGAPEG